MKCSHNYECDIVMVSILVVFIFHTLAREYTLAIPMFTKKGRVELLSESKPKKYYVQVGNVMIT